MFKLSTLYFPLQSALAVPIWLPVAMGLALGLILGSANLNATVIATKEPATRVEIAPSLEKTPSVISEKAQAPAQVEKAPATRKSTGIKPALKPSEIKAAESELKSEKKTPVETDPDKRLAAKALAKQPPVIQRPPSKKNEL